MRRRFLAFWAALCLLAACSPHARHETPVSPLPLPPSHMISPLPGPSMPRTLVLASPRAFMPIARTAGIVIEDGCSLNATAAAMLATIRTASWQERAQVICHPALALAADWKARDMAAQTYVAHISPDGTAPNDYVRAHGFALPAWYAPGANNVESIAGGFPYYAPEIVLAAWATSPSHWDHIAARHSFFQGQECAAVGYAFAAGGFFHYWVFVSAPCP